MDRGQGDIQRGIMVALKEKPKSVREIAREINKPNEAVRQALRRLEKAGLVEQPNLFLTEDGWYCWVLSAKVRNAQAPHLRQVK